MNLETIIQTANIYSQGVDNLFNARHRALMIEKHGGTMAQTTYVIFNKESGKAEIVYDN